MCAQPPLTGLDKAGATISDVEELLNVRKDAWEGEDSGWAVRGSPTQDPAPFPSSNFLPEVSTSHGEAVHVVEEVDVTQHGHYESRTARRQARDALQSFLVRELGILGLRIPHGPRQPWGAGRRPVVCVIRLAEEGRGVGPGHGPGGPRPPALRSHRRSHLRGGGGWREEATQARAMRLDTREEPAPKHRAGGWRPGSIMRPRAGGHTARRGPVELG